MKSLLSNEKLIEIEGLSFSYNSKSLLNQVSFNVYADGNIVCLLGPSGSGKSTLLKIVLDEIEIGDGKVKIRSGYLPIYQDFERMIIPWLKVERNILFGLDVYDRVLFKEIVDMLEISKLTHSFPYELSGGEKQRVVFARLLMRLPRLIIVDEPLSSIDVNLSARIIAAIKRFLKTNSISALWVTHNISEAAKLADNVVIINAQGSVDEFILKEVDNLQQRAFLIQEKML